MDEAVRAAAGGEGGKEVRHDTARRSAGGQAREKAVLLLISNLGLGGAERQLFYLAAGLRRRGWKVTIGTMTPLVAPSFKVKLDALGVRVVPLQHGMERTLGALTKAVGRAIGLARELRPSVVIGFMPHGALLARLIGVLLPSTRVLISLRNSRSTHRWHDRVLALTRRFDEAVVTNSHLAAEAQIEAGVVSREKTVVIHNGFDPNRVVGADRVPETLGGDFVWLNISVLRQEKDHFGLLIAASQLAEMYRFRLKLVGDGPLRKAIEQMAADLGISHMVDFLGLQSEVAPFIARADAFVLASKWEGLPNVLIEAHAGGLPVVTTDVGGCREVVREGTSGFLVRPENADELVRAMARMMDLDPAARKAMGRAGRAHAIEQFSMENMIDRWERLMLARG